jgi:hypothetical protein
MCRVLLPSTESANKSIFRVKSEIFRRGNYNLKFSTNCPVYGCALYVKLDNSLRHEDMYENYGKGANMKI